MDTRHDTLYRLLESLDDNNERLGWNMYLNKRGHIIVKICYDEETKLDSSEISDMPFETVSYRRKTSKEIHRNQLRAQNFRENIQPAKRPRISSPEILRQNFQHSSPVQNIDVTKCEEESSSVSEPTTHDLSASYQCFESEPIKPAIEQTSPSVMPEKPITIQKKTSPKHQDQRHHRDSKNKPYPKDDDSKPKKSSETPKPEIKRCTYGWCAVAEMHTGCMCTAEIHPCSWCIDTKLAFSKMCSKCRDRD